MPASLRWELEKVWSLIIASIYVYVYLHRDGAQQIAHWNDSAVPASLYTTDESNFAVRENTLSPVASTN